jgi:photosystem II stability/assembly factor-like uncharacterized protein
MLRKVFLLICILMFNVANGQEWENVGPSNASFSKVIKTDNGYYFAVATMYSGLGVSGLFRSEDWCVHWEHVNTIGKLIDIDSKNDTLIALVADDVSFNKSRVFRSADYGNSWIDVQLPELLNDFTPIVHTKNAIHIPGRKSLYTSFNGGEDWVTTLRYRFFISFFKSNDKLWFISDTIFTSATDAQLWDTVLASTNFYSAINVVAHHDTLFTTSGPYVSRSTNGGKDWDDFRNFSVGLFDSVNFESVEQFFSDGIYLYVNQHSFNQSSLRILKRSTDNGETWQPVNLEDMEQIEISNVHRFNDTVFFCSTNAGLLRSIGDPPPSHIVSTGFPYSFEHRKVFRHQNNLFLPVKDYAIMKNENGNSLWTFSADGIPRFTTCNNIMNYQDTFYTATNSGEIYKSVDEGNFWMRQETASPFAFPLYDIVGFDSRMFVAAGTHGVYVSEDYGSNWKVAVGGIATYDIRDFLVHKNSLFVFHNKGIYKWGEEHPNWNFIDGQEFSSHDIINLVSDENSLLVFATMDDTTNILFSSSDEGVTWEKKSTIYHLPYLRPSIICGGGIIIISLSNDLGTKLYMTKNFNLPWKELVENDLSVMKQMRFDQFIYTNNVFYVSLIETPNMGVPAYSLWKVDMTNLSIKESDDFNVLHYQIAQNYPNPFNPTTTLSYQIPKSGLVSIQIFDVLGREVATLMNGVKEAGAYSTVWNAGTQPSGIYFYRLTSGNYSGTKKMILLK